MISMCRFSIGKFSRNGLMKSTWAIREGRMLNKMINRGLTKEKSGFKVSALAKKSNLSSAYENEGNTKRMMVFNKIYMENISDMFHTGEFSVLLRNLGVHVVKVKITKCLKFLNIYYVIRRTDVPEELANSVLQKTIKELQEKMGNLRFFGKVPFIRFIKDLRLENEINLEKVFECLNFGKDSGPINAKKFYIPGLTQNPEVLPEMRQDVLGVDVAKIKARISDDILRYKAININFPVEIAEDKFPTKLIKFSKKEFFKFFKRRRIEELKRRKRECQGVFVDENEDDCDLDLDYEFEDDELDNDLEHDCSDKSEDEYYDEYDSNLEHKYSDVSEDEMHKGKIS